jgi:membrane peptidoglycan carboxypeptidase
VHRADGDPLRQVESFTLGTNEVSPLTMADAYATFAARGVHCNPVAISKVVDRTGQELDIPQGDCKQVIEPELADEVNKMLQGVITQGTGTRAAIGRPAAGKTGTTDSRIAVWFIGYTPDLAGAVWAGNPENSQFHLHDLTIGGTFYPGGVCGGCLPGPIWAQAMEGALKGRPKTKFHEPSSFPQAPQPVFTPPANPQPNPEPTFTQQQPQPTKTHTKTQTKTTTQAPKTQQPPPPQPIKTKPKKSPGPGPGGPKCKPQKNC